MSLRIEKIQDLPLDHLDDLLWESKRTGFNAVQRLITNWASGANRFDCPGEAFFMAWRENCMVGICGLNVDPYANSPHIGRVRHLYVTLAHRRQGIGRALSWENSRLRLKHRTGAFTTAPNLPPSRILF